MRIDKSRQHNAPADIQFFRGARFRQRLNLRPSAHSRDHAVLNK